MKHLTIFLILLACITRSEAQVVALPNKFDFKAFSGPVQKLALAVQQQDVKRIHRLAALDTSLINFQEATQGLTLLHYAVITKRYKAAEALLQSGANPNLHDHYDGNTPAIEAARNYDSSKLLSLLLSYGADPNLETYPLSSARHTTTPLIEAIKARRESMDLLLKAGARINYVTRVGHNSPIGTALIFGKLLIAQYLLFEKKADYKIVCGETVAGRILYVSDLLRDITPKVDSEEWQQKQQLIKFLSDLGVDYKLAPIPYRVRHSFGQGYIDSY